MDQALLDAITHKDEDARIVSLDSARGEILYESSHPHMALGEAMEVIELSEKEEVSLLELQTRIPIVSVPVQVARTVFIVHAVVCFLIMTLGFVPYYILDYDESRKLAALTFVVCAFVCGAAYTLLNVFRTHGALLLGFLFTLLCMVGALSALTRSLAPLQGASISFAQSVVVLCYVVKSRAELNEWYIFWFTLVTGVAGWLAGMYVYVAQHDWIAATVLFFFACFVAPPYMALETYLTSRFSVAEKHKLESIVHFYIDPVALVIAHVRELTTRAPPSAPAPPGDA